MWYTCFGTLTTILIAAISTFIVGTSDPSLVDSKLLAPFIRKYVRGKQPIKKIPQKKYHTKTIPEADEENYVKESAL